MARNDSADSTVRLTVSLIATVVPGSTVAVKHWREAQDASHQVTAASGLPPCPALASTTEPATVSAEVCEKVPVSHSVAMSNTRFVAVA